MQLFEGSGKAVPRQSKIYQLKPVTIYALAHPKSPDVIRYIGKTEKQLHRRLAEHVAERNRIGRCHRRNWVKSLFDEGVKPIIWPIEQCAQNNWIEQEKYWIAFFKPLGNLTNGTDGGEGGTGNKGWKWSPEALRKISLKRKAIGASKAQLNNLTMGRIKMLAARVPKMVKTPMSPEERREKRAAWARAHLKWPVGKPRPRRTLESRQRMSLKMMGRKVPWVVRSELNRSITTRLLKESNERKSRAVIAVETGQEFCSIGAAIRELECSPSGFREALKKGWKCRGVHWKFKDKEK